MDKLEKGKRATEKTLEKIGDVPISEIPAEMIERGRAATESLIAKYGHLTVRAINAVTMSFVTHFRYSTMNLILIFFWNCYIFSQLTRHIYLPEAMINTSMILKKR